MAFSVNDAELESVSSFADRVISTITPGRMPGDDTVRLQEAEVNDGNGDVGELLVSG